jgi:hypothetical protein
MEIEDNEKYQRSYETSNNIKKAPEETHYRNNKKQTSKMNNILALNYTEGLTNTFESTYCIYSNLMYIDLRNILASEKPRVVLNSYHKRMHCYGNLFYIISVTMHLG